MVWNGSKSIYSSSTEKSTFEFPPKSNGLTYVSKCGGRNRGEREENSNTGGSLLAVLLRLCLSSKTRSSNEKPRMDEKNRPSSRPVVNAIVNHCIFQWFRFAFRLARNVRAWFRAGGYPGWNPINRKRLFVRMKKSLPRARPLINPDG